MNHDKLSDLLAYILAICAFVVTGIVIQKTYFKKRPLSYEERYIESWHSLSNEGQRFGKLYPAMEIVYFFDYQCPFCKQIDPLLSKIIEEQSDKISLVYRHLPLESIHPAARNAAIASECAGRQGLFEVYHNGLFDNQEVLSIDTRWDSLAIQKGLPDVTSFISCLRDKEVDNRIDRDIAAASSVDIHSVPTIVINGHVISGVPQESELRKIIKKEVGNL